jgi:hypothetical protein
MLTFSVWIGWKNHFCVNNVLVQHLCIGQGPDTDPHGLKIRIRTKIVRIRNNTSLIGNAFVSGSKQTGCHKIT